ncbi:tetratricopeptide repeat protein [Vallitalea sp.]|jgi:tetratricopeptide (TPR) repeat protein|uniref:tetratricopeptide repeat protein n=1 Tax=Vallitalea sp. TaxID=1882829 RepID=UPI0025F2E4E2|nr:tetratricopeptide repeat protein [Vallitalea sp.]MCT4686456.1 tetratricopeptide repeat protein [Vallitalea sp.]
MELLGKKWKLVALVYFIVCYIFVMVIKHMPLSTLLLFYAGFILLTIILFLGTSIGFIGILVQSAFSNEDKAYKFYRLAYKLHTNNISIISSYGLILLKKDNINEAILIFKKALSLKPQFLADKIIKCNIAICHWKLGNIDEAINIYEKVFKDFEKTTDTDDEPKEIEEVSDENEPTDEYVINTNSYVYAQDYTTLGYLYLLKKDYDKAIENSKKSLMLNATHAPALDNLGQIYYELKDYDEAIKYLTSALEINPNMADSNYYMGLIFEQKNDIEEARKYFKKTASCNINALNTVTHEDVERKLKKYKFIL